MYDLVDLRQGKLVRLRGLTGFDFGTIVADLVLL
jgi:hypothetical protein